MKASIKSYLKTLFHMALAGFITTFAYIACDAILRAFVTNFSTEMTLTRSVLYMLAMLGLQVLFCFVLTAFRYSASGDGIRRLTEDCTEEAYCGLASDLKKLFRKEEPVLLTALAVITLSMVQIFIPSGLLGSLSLLFIGINGVSLFIPDLFFFLVTLNASIPGTFGLVLLFCMNGIFLGFALFCILYLLPIARKRKKWYREWKIEKPKE